MSTIVAIVGRPNVGKSTLFNRLTESRKAIVDEHSGVTRDRHYGHAEWNGKKFSVIDTGGYVRGSDDIFEEEIRRQVEVAIEEADLLLFVVDVEIGITDLDDAMAAVLRKTKRKFLSSPIKLTILNGFRMPRCFIKWVSVILIVFLPSVAAEQVNCSMIW